MCCYEDTKCVVMRIQSVLLRGHKVCCYEDTKCVVMRTRSVLL